MKCTGCGTEFSEGRFCPECGTEVLRESKGVYNKLWNHPYFNKAAIVFNHFYDWLMLPASIGWICWMKEIESTWGIIIGVICLLAYLSNIISRFMKKSKFRKENSICPVCKAESQKSQFCSNCGSQMPTITAEELDDPTDNTPEELNRKKKQMIITSVILVLIVVIYSKGGFDLVFKTPVIELKNATFKECTKSFGEMVEDNFKNEEWTCEKIDKDSYHVYVRGFMPLVDEEVEIKFYYEELDNDYFEYRIIHVKLLDSGEKYTDVVNLALFLSVLDGNLDETN